MVRVNDAVLSDINTVSDLSYGWELIRDFVVSMGGEASARAGTGKLSRLLPCPQHMLHPFHRPSLRRAICTSASAKMQSRCRWVTVGQA